jgi:Pyruvate/2-oxoacid:ferredoxin oxidoreductase delta subunit
MPGGRGRGFGRRRGMRGGMSRNNKIVDGLFEWIVTAIQPKNKTDRKVMYRPSIESPDKTNEVNQLKELSRSLQSQLKEVNTRIHKNEVTLVSPFPHIDEAVCTGCGKCALICLSEAIILENRIPHIDQNKCTGCGICVSECPAHAIEMIR